MPRVDNRMEENSPWIQRDFRYGDFGSRRMLKLESSNFLVMTQLFTWVPNNDAATKIF
jgi:hypothetical protein